jgi:hypothetical protein
MMIPEDKMPPKEAAITHVMKKLRLDTPLIAVYDTPLSDEFHPLVMAKGHACCFAFYKRWLAGETVAFTKAPEESEFTEPTHGCPGAQRALGLVEKYPPYMANFLTDGKGAPMGEGLMATPELAQEFLDRSVPPKLSGDSVLIGPLRLEQWGKVRSVTFLVDADRLSAVMRLAGYWSSDPDLIAAPFSSGCGLLWREVENQERDRPVIGCTDMAMRKYIPPEILCLTVTPGRFEQMMTVPDGSFLDKSWWNELMDSRKQ